MKRGINPAHIVRWKIKMAGTAMSPAEYPELFRKQFELCNVRKGESVILLSNHNTDRELIEAAFAGMQALGAEGFEIGLPKPLDLKKVGHETTGGGSGVMTALKSADLICPFFSAQSVALAGRMPHGRCPRSLDL